MRNRLAIFALLYSTMLLAGCTIWREHAVVNNWSDATGGEGLERSFWKDVQSKNWTPLEHHIAGNYIVVTPDGRLDRTAALQRLQQMQLEECSLGDFQVELNANTLVVTYTATMRGSLAGQPLPSNPVRMMTVWQQQKAGWMAIAHFEGPMQK